MKIKIKKLTKTAIVPTQSEPGAAGMDLYADDDYHIIPCQRKLISTGISMAITPGFYGHISDRSGMAWKKGAHCLGKIIDQTFRGEIKVVLLNTDNLHPIEIKKGDRIAQIIFHRYFTPEFELVDDLEQTERGEGGFGSSGV